MKIGDDVSAYRPNVTRIYDIRGIIARRMKPTKLNPDGYEKYEAVAEIVKIISKNPAPETQKLGPRVSLKADTFFGMLVVQGTEKQHASLAALLKKLPPEP